MSRMIDRCTNRECTICYPNGFVRPAEREDLQGAVWFVAICFAVAAILASMVLSGCGGIDLEPEQAELSSVVVAPLVCPVGHVVHFACPVPANCSAVASVGDGPCHINFDVSCIYGVTGVTSRVMVPLGTSTITFATVAGQQCLFGVER